MYKYNLQAIQQFIDYDNYKICSGSIEENCLFGKLDDPSIRRLRNLLPDCEIKLPSLIGFSIRGQCKNVLKVTCKEKHINRQKMTFFKFLLFRIFYGTTFIFQVKARSFAGTQARHLFPDLET